MEKDLFKELGDAVDRAILREDEMLGIEGGGSMSDTLIDILNGFRCILGQDNTIHCIGNVCDPTNVGGCPSNTAGGGSQTCPLSL